MFDVGPGVLQRMQELNDSPSRNSEFFNSVDQKSRSEWGYGITHDYRAVGVLQTNNTWQWDVYAYKLNLVDTVFYDVVDVQGKLPTRQGAAPYPTRSISGISRFVVHHTAGPQSQTVLDVANYQIGPDAGYAFPAIAYHFLIEADGKVNWCHDLDRRVWGSDGAKAKPININDVSIHACYTGNNNPTEDQIQALHSTRLLCEMELGRAFTIIEGHRDNDYTACPGDSWKAWIDRV